MICECKNPIVQILGVEHMLWKEASFQITPRDYSSLAFRISGTATITVGGKQYFVNENDILYLPQNTSYSAEYSDTEMLVIHFKTLVNDHAPEVYSCANTEQIYKAFLSSHILWKEKKAGLQCLRAVPVVLCFW